MCAGVAVHVLRGGGSTVYSTACTHTHTHTCTHTRQTHTQTHTHTHANAPHACTHMHMYTYTQAHANTHKLQQLGARQEYSCTELVGSESDCELPAQLKTVSTDSV